MRGILFCCLCLFAPLTTANSWIFVDGEQTVCGTAVVMNEDQSFFGISCGYRGGRCMLMMISPDQCNGTIPAILNFDDGFFSAASATCGESNGVGTVFLDADKADRVFKSIFSASHVGVAFPTNDGKFKSYSYSLDGSKVAANKLKKKCFSSEANLPF